MHCVGGEQPFLQRRPKMTKPHSTSPTIPRPYVLLPSGNIIDLADPDPESWTDADLALGLSRIYRWGGHSGWQRPLSVAQHSLTVLAIRETAHALSPQLALYELLHDAEEGLLGFDCIAPLKACLGEPFRQLSGRLTAAIASRYRLPDLTPAEHKRHKQADRRAAASEALHVVHWTRDQIENILQMPERPLAVDPLLSYSQKGGYLPWEPWTSDYAAARWLKRLQTEIVASTPATTGPGR